MKSTRKTDIVAINFHNPYSSADNCNPSIQEKEHIGTKIKKESNGSFSLSYSLKSTQNTIRIEKQDKRKAPLPSTSHLHSYRQSR